MQNFYVFKTLKGIVDAWRAMKDRNSLKRRNRMRVRERLRLKPELGKVIMAIMKN